MLESDLFPLPPRLAAILADLPLEELAFTPVPVRPRRDGWTPERQRAFILRLALCGCTAVAARAVGKSRKSAYDLRAHPGGASFARAWDRAAGWGQSRVTDIGMERALVGERRKLWYRGELCEQIRFDNRLAMAVLNRLDRGAALRPEPPDLQDWIDGTAPGLFVDDDPPAENKGFSPPTCV
jgi:hypothetical protein